MLPERAPASCRQEGCHQPPTCWVNYYTPDGSIVGVVFTCDPHQAEYIDRPTAGEGDRA